MPQATVPLKTTRPAQPPVISLRGLAKHFGPVRAVDGVDLVIFPGECFGLLGLNGAGKSTLIKMIIGLLPPDRGQVVVNGFDLIRHATQVRRSVGYVAQSLSVDSVLTGRENLAFFGRLYGLGGQALKERVAEILDLLELGTAADRLVAQYSGGMVRRLEIGQSILHRPPVLILDEPTTGLDPIARTGLWKHIQGLQERQGMTVLVTTHLMDEARRLCPRLAILRQGKVVGLGSPLSLAKAMGRPKAGMDEIFARYAGQHADQLEENSGGLDAIGKSRRIARRLG
jgi:ABC-2 type transport system ATP-binding protein